MKMKSKRDKDDSLRSEYDLNNLLKDGVQGKYAQLYKKGTNLVLLEPDVAKAFKNEKVINEALRLVIQLKNLSMPKKLSTGIKQ
jgi:hypothetical protein